MKKIGLYAAMVLSAISFSSSTLAATVSTVFCENLPTYAEIRVKVDGITWSDWWNGESVIASGITSNRKVISLGIQTLIPSTGTYIFTTDLDAGETISQVQAFTTLEPNNKESAYCN